MKDHSLLSVIFSKVNVVVRASSRLRLRWLSSQKGRVPDCQNASDRVWLLLWIYPPVCHSLPAIQNVSRKRIALFKAQRWLVALAILCLPHSNHHFVRCAGFVYGNKLSNSVQCLITQHLPQSIIEFFEFGAVSIQDPFILTCQVWFKVPNRNACVLKDFSEFGCCGGVSSARILHLCCLCNYCWYFVAESVHCILITAGAQWSRILFVIYGTVCCCVLTMLNHCSMLQLHWFLSMEVRSLL